MIKKRTLGMLAGISLIVLGCLLSSSTVKTFGDCKVLLEAISKTYEGDCKKGLANGEGKATGEDTYEGEFKKGYPNGEGTYTFANGNVYKGEFKKGDIEGKGIMTFAKGEKTLDGYWTEGEYIGENKYPYKITNKTNSVSRVSFKRLAKEPNQIDFRFSRLGKPAKGKNLSLLGTYGVILNETDYIKTAKVHEFPFHGGVNFSAQNSRETDGGSGGEYISANVEFDLTLAGYWEITFEMQVND